MKNYILVAVLSGLIASSVTALASGPGTPFTDVDEDTYYYDSVENMRMLGIISGYEDGSYGPENYVNRADLAVMLDRYNDALIPENGVSSGIADLISLVCASGFNVDESLGYNDSYIEVLEESYTEVCLAN